LHGLVQRPFLVPETVAVGVLNQMSTPLKPHAANSCRCGDYGAGQTRCFPSIAILLHVLSSVNQHFFSRFSLCPRLAPLSRFTPRMARSLRLGRRAPFRPSTRPPSGRTSSLPSTTRSLRTIASLTPSTWMPVSAAVAQSCCFQPLNVLGT
jgi:hypothetical protein